MTFSSSIGTILYCYFLVFMLHSVVSLIYINWLQEHAKNLHVKRSISLIYTNYFLIKRKIFQLWMMGKGNNQVNHNLTILYRWLSYNLFEIS